MADSLYPGAKADEFNCAQEPIHIPGMIQPHGMLLGLDRDKIIYASKNSESYFGNCLNGKSEILPAKLTALLSAMKGNVPTSPQRIGTETFGDKSFDLVVHRSRGIWVLEMEEVFQNDRPSFSSIYQAVHRALEEIEGASSLAELWQKSAEECRRLSGYDRVMIYQFDPEWNGTVVAESKSADLEPFLGLRYPASDIPAQARALYEKNWIRAIPDVKYNPVAILAALESPLDLSQSTLRSVSPVHLEYLKNMGVGASMSVSLLKEGKLWGLIAFHHRHARHLAFETRQGLEFLGRFLSLQIIAKENISLGSEREKIALLRTRLERKLRGSADFKAEIIKESQDFLALVPGSMSGALMQGERILSTTAAPSIEALQQIHGWLRVNVGKQPFFETENFSSHFAPAASIAGLASGLLCLTIPEAEPAYLVWFKPEMEKTVNWAGKPEKLTEFESGKLKLGPRKSFEIWRENLRGYSSPFQREEIAELDLFRRSLLELDLERQVQAAVRSNEELDQFALAIAHDLKEPLRGIQSFAHFLKEDLASPTPDAALENLKVIEDLASKARLLITELYNYSRLGQLDLALTDVDLNEVLASVKQTAELTFKEGSGHLIIPRPLPILRCDKVRVQEIFLNLVTNALKYNEAKEKVVTIDYRLEDGQFIFCVSDNGIGIRPSDFDRIFRVFERLHGPDLFGGGTGIGLAIVKRAVEMHSGRIWVEPLPNGSRFCFTLSPKPTNLPQ